MSSGSVDLGSTFGGGVNSLNSITGAVTIVAGSGISVTPAGQNITISATGGGGTVTSVALTVPSILAVSGSPVTTAGTLAVTLNTQSANLVFAGPTSGGAAIPTFRSLAATDLPTGNLTDAGTDGITITSGTGAVIGSGTSISQHVADTTHNGYLASTDWNTFNGKQSALTIGNLTDPGTDGITVTGGTGAIIGTGVTLSQHVADTTHNGYLSSTDWNTFNGKQAAGNYITALTSDVSATGPGSVAATVNSVGGSSAANIHSAELAANAATSANTVSTIVKRDSSGNFSAGTITASLTGNATNITGNLAFAQSPSPQTTKDLYVDGLRTDTYTADGSILRPFKTIAAALAQIVTNADNASNPYLILLATAGYSETVTLNNALYYNITIAAKASAEGQIGSTSFGPGTGTAITSTSNNTHLTNLAFIGLTINGDVILTGDINNTNFLGTAGTFVGCNIQKSNTGFLATNVNNLYFYDTAFNSTGTGPLTFNNVAFGLLEQGDGIKSGVTMSLVDNPGGNVPAQYSGNYFLMERSTLSPTTLSVDAGSELDSVHGYMGGGTITMNGTWHNYGTVVSAPIVLNSGSAYRTRGPTHSNTFTPNGGSTVTNQGVALLASSALGASAVPATNVVLVTKDGHIKSAQTTAPTTTTNANAGTGASSSVANATDTAGVLNLTLGSIATLSSGVQVTVNFNKAYNVAPLTVVTPTNATTAANVSAFGVFVTSTTSGFSINFGTAGVATDVLQWNYYVIETQ